MSTPAAFQRYQQQFAAHLRDPQTQPRPAKVAARRMRVYRDIVFNNLLSSVSACFPVCRQVLGARAWRRLVRSFFAGHASPTPIFREIPQQFLHFLQQRAPDTLPAYLSELAHYEWMELALAVAPEAAVEAGQDMALSIPGELLAQRPVLAPVLALLHYDYPVQLISPRFKPRQPQPVDLLMFRDAEDEVRFIALNPLTARLLALLQQQGGSGAQAVQQLAQEMAVQGQPMALGSLAGFALQLLQSLQQQGAILGSRALAAG